VTRYYFIPITLGDDVRVDYVNKWGQAGTIMGELSSERIIPCQPNSIASCTITSSAIPRVGERVSFTVTSKFDDSVERKIRDYNVATKYYNKDFRKTLTRNYDHVIPKDKLSATLITPQDIVPISLSDSRYAPTAVDVTVTADEDMWHQEDYPACKKTFMILPELKIDKTAPATPNPVKKPSPSIPVRPTR
jgi:hypothetical protein